MRFGRTSLGTAAVLAVSGVLLLLGSAAWACTPSPGILTVGPPLATPESVVSVQGEAMRPGAPVEIRWNGAQGPVVGVVTTDSKGSFSTSVTVPPAVPGLYYMVATTPAGLSRAQVEVVGQWTGSGSRTMKPSSPGFRDSGSVRRVAVLTVGLVALVGLAAAAGTSVRRTAGRSG